MKIKEESKMKKGLTISLIIESESSNYGEGFGNITSLKKLSRGNGKNYSYISRQALRYNIIEQLGWNDTPVEEAGKGNKKVIQYHPDAEIDKFPEIDLFGYMKTTSGSSASTRSAVVRLSNAISLESFDGDMDFLTNMGLSSRINKDNSIANNEIHKSYYTYTITVDLDRVGIDNEIEISSDEKAKRVKDLLETLKFLYRDIKGRRENLSPVFAIGGIYERKNPFFENRLTLYKMMLDIKKIKAIMSLDDSIKNNTKIGYLENTFSNNNRILEELIPTDISDFFNNLKIEVDGVYNESY
jgi:CRISPR-associated protein Cst2